MPDPSPGSSRFARLRHPLPQGERGRKIAARKCFSPPHPEEAAGTHSAKAAVSKDGAASRFETRALCAPRHWTNRNLAGWCEKQCFRALGLRELTTGCTDNRHPNLSCLDRKLGKMHLRLDGSFPYKQKMVLPRFVGF